MHTLTEKGNDLGLCTYRFRTGPGNVDTNRVLKRKVLIFRRFRKKKVGSIWLFARVHLSWCCWLWGPQQVEPSGCRGQVDELARQPYSVVISVSKEPGAPRFFKRVLFWASYLPIHTSSIFPHVFVATKKSLHCLEGLEPSSLFHFDFPVLHHGCRHFFSPGGFSAPLLRLNLEGLLERIWQELLGWIAASPLGPFFFSPGSGAKFRICMRYHEMHV